MDINTLMQMMYGSAAGPATANPISGGMATGNMGLNSPAMPFNGTLAQSNPQLQQTLAGLQYGMSPTAGAGTPISMPGQSAPPTPGAPLGPGSIGTMPGMASGTPPLGNTVFPAGGPNAGMVNYDNGQMSAVPRFAGGGQHLWQAQQYGMPGQGATIHPLIAQALQNIMKNSSFASLLSRNSMGG